MSKGNNNWKSIILFAGKFQTLHNFVLPRNGLGAVWIALEFEKIWGDLGNSGTCTLEPES
jgi:hypothetical protein